MIDDGFFILFENVRLIGVGISSGMINQWAIELRIY